MAENVATHEAALLAAIDALDDENKDFCTEEYKKPPDEVYDAAVQMMEPNILQLAAGISGAFNGSVDLTAESAPQTILAALYENGIFETEPIDEAKEAYFLALLTYHSEEFVQTKTYTETEIAAFIRFLFEKRTLLAASIINLKRAGNTLNP